LERVSAIRTLSNKQTNASHVLIESSDARASSGLDHQIRGKELKSIVAPFVGVGLAALVLTSCATAPATQVESGGPAPEPTGGSTTTFADGLLTYQPTKVGESFIGMSAQMEGTLTFENGCLLVGGAPMVFPADDTSWDGTTLTANGNKFVVGENINVGGGGIDVKLPDNTPNQCGGLTPWYAWGAEAVG
jgi:hypothetical protein